ncbi:MAG: tetratricopeptide repeat protein [Cyanobacteria bacterium J06638_6]
MAACVRDRKSPTALPTPSAPDPQTEALRHCELGKIYLEQGRYRQALEHIEQALALQPHDVDSWYSRANALACLNRYDDAMDSLEQAQSLTGGDDAHLWVQKATLQILLNQPKAALNSSNRAIWLSPHHAQAWLFRGVALHRLGRFDDSYRSYQRVTQPDADTSANAIRRLCHDIAPNQVAGSVCADRS